MHAFSLTGKIGCVFATGPEELTLAIASALEREGQPSRVAWVLCVARDGALRTKIAETLHEGDIVQIHGALEQKQRQTQGVTLTSTHFVIGTVERLSEPVRDHTL